MRANLKPLAIGLASVALLTSALAQVSVRHSAMKSARAGYYAAEARIPAFRSSAPVPSLASRTVAAAMRSGYNEFLMDARKMPGRPTGSWFYSSETVVSISRADLVSVLIETHTYTGGAHPNTFLKPHNFALVSGKPSRLVLDHLLVPGRKGTLIGSILQPRLLEMKKQRFGEDALEAEFDEQLAESFLLTPAGISWVFEPYAAGAYAEGTYIVKVPWSDLDPHLSPLGRALAGRKSAPSTSTNMAVEPRLVGTWELTSFEYSDDTIIRVDDPTRYSLTLSADGSASLQVDVNRGTARVTAGNGSFQYTGGALTRAAPGPGSHHDRFLRDLPDVATYVVRDQVLYLNLKYDGGNLVFRKA